MPLTLTRSLLVILVPGVIAVGPWLFVLMRLFPEAGRVYHAYETATHVCVFALVVVVGSIIEGLNTHLELWFDREREAEFQIERNWYDYLAAQCSSEPVAFQYISRLVTMLHF